MVMSENYKMTIDDTTERINRLMEMRAILCERIAELQINLVDLVILERESRKQILNSREECKKKQQVITLLDAKIDQLRNMNKVDSARNLSQ